MEGAPAHRDRQGEPQAGEEIGEEPDENRPNARHA